MPTDSADSERLRAGLPAHVLCVLRTLTQAGFEACLVGGAVRDLLLCRTPGDYDVASSASPEQVKALFARTLPTGEKYGTVTVFCEGNQTEVTAFRTEGCYRDGRRPSEVHFAGTIEDDLARRDFTVNAMAWDERRGLIDPYGGRADLARGVIRAVGDPVRRFEEDALRILRAYRFCAQLGFALEPATRAAARSCAPLTARLSVERVLAEVTNILLSDRPQTIFELAALRVPEPLAGLRPKAGGALCRVPPELISRFAALFYDTGADPHAVLPALRADNNTQRGVKALLGLLRQRPPSDKTSLKTLLREYGPACVRRALPFWDEAARLRAEALLREVFSAGEPYCLAMLAVSGEDLSRAGLAPGPVYKEILSRLLTRVIEEPGLNKKDTLLRMAVEWNQEFTFNSSSKTYPPTPSRAREGE